MNKTTLAIDNLLRAIGDPVSDLRGIGPGHPEFELAQIIRAGAGVLAKTPEALPSIAEVIQTTRGSAISHRGRAHLAAAEAWLAGDPVLATERYEAIVNRWHDDLLGLRLAQSCCFFLGWQDRLLEITDRAMYAWPHDRVGFEAVLAMASFAHAEGGDADCAEALGRRALANNPACPMGVHAVAHSIAEAGRPRAGAAWMREQLEHWAGESRMRVHNAWHLAMFNVDAGDIASALGILDEWLLPASAGSSLDACDAAALLWRLATEGVDVESRWDLVSNAFEQRLTPGFWPYVDLHAALAHNAAGKPRRAQRLVQAIEQCSAGNSHAASRARNITGPGLRALGAWSEGRHGEAAARFAALKPLLASAGGSRIQLEIFDSLGREAGRRQGTFLPSRKQAFGESARAGLADLVET